MNDTMKASFIDELRQILVKEAQGPLAKALGTSAKWVLGPGKAPVLLIGGGALAYHHGHKALEAHQLGRAMMERQSQMG